MSCCKLRLGGWMRRCGGWVGGWVGDVPVLLPVALRLHPVFSFGPWEEEEQEAEE